MKISKILKNKIKKILSRYPVMDLELKKKTVFLLSKKYTFSYLNCITNEKQFLFECFKGKFVNDSPWSIYQTLSSLNKDATFIWVLQNPEHPLLEKMQSMPNTKVVFYGTEEYLKAYASSKYWITNCRIPFRIAKKPEQVFIQCWHGTPLKKMAHDIKVGSNAKTSLEGLKFAYDHEVRRLDFFVSPSPYASKCFCSSFNMPKSKVLESGYPRNDRLINHRYDVDLISKIKTELGINENKKVILYAPTWRDDKVSNFDGRHILTNPLDCEEFLNHFPDTVFLYRGHYFTHTEKSMVNFIDVSDYNDVNDLFLISDSLVTDYSSLFFDYAILCKPIYFYMPDLEEYREKTRGFYLDVESELPGPIVRTPKELAEVMSEQFDLSIFALFNKKYNCYEEGHSALNVLQKVGIL